MLAVCYRLSCSVMLCCVLVCSEAEVKLWQVGTINSAYRVFQMEVVAGEPRFETEVVQFKARFRLDFSKVGCTTLATRGSQIDGTNTFYRLRPLHSHSEWHCKARFGFPCRTGRAFAVAPLNPKP